MRCRTPRWRGSRAPNNGGNSASPLLGLACCRGVLTPCGRVVDVTGTMVGNGWSRTTGASTTRSRDTRSCEPSPRSSTTVSSPTSLTGNGPSVIGESLCFFSTLGLVYSFRRKTCAPTCITSAGGRVLLSI